MTDHKKPGFPGAQHSTPPRREYFSAQCYSDGSPLPDGWVIELNAGDPGDVRPRYRARLGSTTYIETHHREQAEAYIRAMAAGRESTTQDAAEASVVGGVTHDATPGATDRERTRANLWFATAALMGLIVGGTTVGLVATNQAPDAPVTPAACVAALDRAEDLMEAYGDGFKALGLTQAVPRAQGARAASDEANRLTPLYQSEAMKCRVQQ